MLRRTTGLLLTAIFVGLITGTLIGELVARFAPEGPLKEFLLTKIRMGFTPTTLDLIVVKFTFGLSLSFNLLSILILFLVILAFKKL